MAGGKREAWGRQVSLPPPELRPQAIPFSGRRHGCNAES